MASSSAVEIDPDVLATLATKADLAPLATRDEMHMAIAAAVAPLATREELRMAIAAAVAPLATREELHAAIAAAIAPLATREELHAAIVPLATRDELHALRAELLAEIRQEGEQTRRYFDIVAERVESSVSFIAEGHASLDAKIEGVRGELKADVAGLDRRVTRLETRRRPR
jgi:hypothetical protein